MKVSQAPLKNLGCELLFSSPLGFMEEESEAQRDKRCHKVTESFSCLTPLSLVVPGLPSLYSKALCPPQALREFKLSEPLSEGLTPLFFLVLLIYFALLYFLFSVFYFILFVYNNSPQLLCSVKANDLPVDPELWSFVFSLPPPPSPCWLSG